MTLPAYFSVNGRPVKLVETPDGGMDVQALDLETGEFVRRTEYLSRVTLSDDDTDDLTEAEFEALVARRRAAIARRNEG